MQTAFIYATGITNSPDFPTTNETASPPSAKDYRPFVIKLNDRGEVFCSALIPAPGASPGFIAVNAKGEALIFGQSVEFGEVRFPATPGSVGSAGANTGFLIKLAGSKILVGIRGCGPGPS